MSTLCVCVCGGCHSIHAILYHSMDYLYGIVANPAGLINKGVISWCCLSQWQQSGRRHDRGGVWAAALLSIDHQILSRGGEE